MRTAREYMARYVHGFVKANFDNLKNRKQIEDSKARLLKDILKDPINGLDWTLGEILDQYEFKELGIVISDEWKTADGGIEFHELIYKIGHRHVRRTSLFGKYMYEPMNYEFVKPVKKKVYVLTYEPVSNKQKSKS